MPGYTQQRSIATQDDDQLGDSREVIQLDGACSEGISDRRFGERFKTLRFRPADQFARQRQGSRRMVPPQDETD